jgi:hypothetical protein
VSFRVASVGLALVAMGCASAGAAPGAEEGREPVPVYARESDVPCRFENVQTVRGSASVTSYEEFAREREKVLAREGARVGADAVLLPASEERRGVAVTARVGPGGVQRLPTQISFEGQAIRFVEGTCR